jgi:Na+/H+-dicarboxylate symporter
MLAPLFVAIGLPVEGIGILIAVDAIPDTFATMLNVTGYLAAATLAAPRTTALPLSAQPATPEPDIERPAGLPPSSPATAPGPFAR